MKSPSHFDGKPIGAPTDAKSPFHAGVTIGPDQIERMEEVRRLRNRLLKAEAKQRRREMKAATTPEQREAYKARRKRADNMTRALRNGKPTKAVADWWGISRDDVMAEVRWLSAQRNGHRARHRRGKGREPELPARQGDK